MTTVYIQMTLSDDWELTTLASVDIHDPETAVQDVARTFRELAGEFEREAVAGPVVTTVDDMGTLRYTDRVRMIDINGQPMSDWHDAVTYWDNDGCLGVWEPVEFEFRAGYIAGHEWHTPDLGTAFTSAIQDYLDPDKHTWTIPGEHHERLPHMRTP